MAKKHNIIEINGRRYDAATGLPLDTGKIGHISHQPAPPAHQAEINIPVHVLKPATKTHSHSGRSRAKNLSSHQPQPAKTLMRQAVRKPELASRTIRIKTIGRVDLPNKGLVVLVKPSISRLDESRLQRANHVKRSHSISRFNRRQIWAGADFIASSATTVSATPFAQATSATKKVASKPRTTADILDMAIQNATSHLQPAAEPTRHRRVWHRRHAQAAH